MKECESQIFVLTCSLVSLLDSKIRIPFPASTFLGSLLRLCHGAHAKFCSRHVVSAVMGGDGHESEITALLGCGKCYFLLVGGVLKSAFTYRFTPVVQFVAHIEFIT